MNQLFHSIRVGRSTLQNRLVMAPVRRQLSCPVRANYDGRLGAVLFTAFSFF